MKEALQNKIKLSRDKRRGKCVSAPAEPKTEASEKVKPHGRCELQLFGQKVNVPDDRPQKSRIRLTAKHLVDPASAPDYLQEEIANHRKIAEHHGAKLDKLTLEHARYLLKGYYQLVAIQTREGAA
jgi:hypothetical protein